MSYEALTTEEQSALVALLNKATGAEVVAPAANTAFGWMRAIIPPLFTATCGGVRFKLPSDDKPGSWLCEFWAATRAHIKAMHEAPKLSSGAPRADYVPAALGSDGRYEPELLAAGKIEPFTGRRIAKPKF
jgi:hypothetical protein